jgi:hypothetical protein
VEIKSVEATGYHLGADQVSKALFGVALFSAALKLVLFRNGKL